MNTKTFFSKNVKTIIFDVIISNEYRKRFFLLIYNNYTGRDQCPICFTKFPEKLVKNLVLCAVVKQLRGGETKKKKASIRQSPLKGKHGVTTKRNTGTNDEADPISAAIHQVKTRAPSPPVEMMMSEDEEMGGQFFVPHRPKQKRPTKYGRRYTNRRVVEQKFDPISNALHELKLEEERQEKQKSKVVEIDSDNPIVSALKELKSRVVDNNTSKKKKSSSSSTITNDDPIGRALREMTTSDNDPPLNVFATSTIRVQNNFGDVERVPAAPRKSNRSRRYKLRGRDSNNGMLSPRAVESSKLSYQRRHGKTRASFSSEMKENVMERERIERERIERERVERERDRGGERYERYNA
mgnify:CR=1 FL=1